MKIDRSKLCIHGATASGTRGSRIRSVIWRARRIKVGPVRRRNARINNCPSAYLLPPHRIASQRRSTWTDDEWVLCFPLASRRAQRHHVSTHERAGEGGERSGVDAKNSRSRGPSISPSLRPRPSVREEREMTINYGDGRHRAALEQKCERGRAGIAAPIVQNVVPSQSLRMKPR